MWLDLYMCIYIYTTICQQLWYIYIYSYILEILLSYILFFIFLYINRCTYLCIYMYIYICISLFLWDFRKQNSECLTRQPRLFSPSPKLRLCASFGRAADVFGLSRWGRWVGGDQGSKENGHPVSHVWYVGWDIWGIYMYIYIYIFFLHIIIYIYRYLHIYIYI